MQRLTTVSGRMLPLFRDDIDTDQIMPKQFLKRVERTGFGDLIFFDWRQDPEFVLNDPSHKGAEVLVTGSNFGAGSSREHAPWGLQEHGFRAIIAPSFADIFATNCTKIGLLLVVQPKEVCRQLADLAEREPSTEITIDLPAQRITCPGMSPAHFEIDEGVKNALINGLDEIATTLNQNAAVSAYEHTRPGWMPTTTSDA